MDFDQVTILLDYARAVFKEFYLHRFKVVILSILIAFCVLVAGHLHKETYQSSTTIFADQQNIIRPLLRGQASVTKLQDQIRVVRETIYAPRILREAVQQAGLVDEGVESAELEQMVNAVRARLKIIGVGGSFIKLTYSDNSSTSVFRFLSALTDLFIKDTSETKRQESREAYEFINRQVKSYKSQLQEAEERLKVFKEESTEGSEQSVKSRISQLQSKIETIKLDIEEENIRIEALKRQLADESQFVNKRYESEVYRQRVLKLQENLERLRMVYTDTHPDVVALKQQINDLNNTINEVDTEKSRGATIDSDVKDSNVNPLYEELRSKLGESSIAVETRQRRLVATQRLLDAELGRLKKIAAGQAELAELTRDYDVNKSIYEDMLERKEKARLSMTLDVEGRGINYRIQEPAAYPLSPKGLRFFHFAVVGPLLGLIAAIGILIAYVVLDPRIRFIYQLQQVDGGALLGVVPHIHTPIKNRLFRLDVWLMIGLIVCSALVYIAMVYLHGA